MAGRMNPILKLIVNISLICSVVASVKQRRQGDISITLCQDINRINEEANQKLREAETAIAKLRTECICAFNKDFDARLHDLKKEISTTRSGCFCSAPKTDCPEGWSLFQGICFSFQSEKLNWDAAQKRCQDLGGTLAAADTEETNNFLVNLANQMGPGGTQYGPWIGGKWTEGSWVWTKTGKSLVYENWWPGQPDHLSEKCIHYWSYNRMKWNDASCSMEFQFICEKQMSD